MSVKLNANVERDVRDAKFVRVAVYPAVRGWVGERVQLEVSNSLETLGVTDWATEAGHYLVVDDDPAEVVAAINALRSKAQRQAYLMEVMP